MSPIELVTRILAEHRLSISVVDAECSCADEWWLPIDHVGAIQKARIAHEQHVATRILVALIEQGHRMTVEH